MATIKLSLNNIPDLYDYEDFVSAYLLLGGYALDRSIPMKVDNAGDIFEVDILSHQFRPDRDNKMLIEIKSRKWSLCFQGKGMDGLSRHIIGCLYMPDED